MLLLLTLLACADYSMVEIKEPEIIIAPDTLDFGHLLSGFESLEKEITIANGGTQDLIVDYLQIFGENYSTELEGFVVPAGGWHQIDVSYTPLTFEHNEGYVDIYLPGENTPVDTVWLTGNGDAPLINLNPLSVDFGTPLLGCQPSEEITIQNDGNVDLSISDITLMSSVPQELHLNYGSLPAFPWTIYPGHRISFWMDYLPSDELSDTLSFEIHSSDPHSPLIASSAIGAAVLSNEIHHTWVQEESVIVDIIWVIDNSGSMYGFQSLLSQNMTNFMNIFLSFAPDYQIVFITTDNPTFVGPIINSQSSDPSSMSSNQVSQIGTHGSATEAGITQLKACFEWGQCSTFVRPDSKIVAIFMSDEADHSIITPTALQNYFNQNWSNEFIPFAIIGDTPVGCNNVNLIAQAGWGYWDLVNLYSSSWWSICDGDWGSQMEDVAVALSIKSFFEFSEIDPVVDSIKVFINGQESFSGWSYDSLDNGVRFEPGEAPEPGDVVEIVYSVWGCSH